jgi:hypothetical protein
MASTVNIHHLRVLGIDSGSGENFSFLCAGWRHLDDGISGISNIEAEPQNVEAR